MAMIRQSGKGTPKRDNNFIFSPVNSEIDLSGLSPDGDFSLTITAIVKGNNGHVLTNQEIRFEINNQPSWLLLPKIVKGDTNINGYASVVVKGKILPSETGYHMVSFILKPRFYPELSEGGTIRFTGSLPKKTEIKAGAFTAIIAALYGV